MRDRSCHEVQAVRYGSLRTTRSELYYRYESYGEPDAEAEMAYYFWLLRSRGETIVVDCGFDPAVGARRGRTCLCRRSRRCARSASSPRRSRPSSSRISTTTTSGTSRRSRTATLIVPRRELEFWTARWRRGFQFGSHVEAREIAGVARARRGRVA